MNPGTRLGPYEILTKIGEGGMGAVYKARDTRLDRTVAIKRSAEAFNERFEREAQAIAALNHPNICTLFDVGPDYLVMELVDGKPLSGPVPVDEAIRYAIQIASALDAAHRRGITHRDLKPANILVTKAGVKLLDFGLAKLVKPVVDRDATQVMGMTQPGMIMGTPQYMSPEQVEAQEADARRDIFSFGVILYELITGRKALEGKTAASVMASVLREQPPSMTTLVPVTPPALERIVKRCIEKDPDDRFQAARDVMHSLEDLGAPEQVSAPAQSNAKWRILAAALGAALLATAGARLSITPPAEIEFGFNDAISPDGKSFVACAATGCWLRSLENETWKQLLMAELGAELGAPPFWSPDSKSLAIHIGQELRRIDVSSGASQVIASNVSQFRGGSWNKDDVVIYAHPGQGIFRVPANGGSPQLVFKPDATRKESANYWPSFLPDGDHFLFTIRSDVAGNYGLYVGSLKNPATKTKVVDSVGNAAFIPASNGQPDFLVYARDNTLVAQQFNLGSKIVQGEPIRLNQVARNSGRLLINFSASANGTIILGNVRDNKAQLAWISRQGTSLGPVGPLDSFSGQALSPDASRVVLRRVRSNGNSELLLLEIGRGVLSPLAPMGVMASWSPDGREIVYYESDAIVRKRYDSNEPGKVVGRRKSHAGVTHLSWSPDGKFAISGPEVIRLEGDDPTPKLDAELSQCRFSPDGKWLSCASNRGSRVEVIVQSFPDPKSRWQVSTQGGNYPRWRADGKELYYISSSRELTAVTVKPSGNGLAFDAPIALFRYKGYLSNGFDATRDGQKFLVLGGVETADAREMTVLLNWREGLKVGSR